MTVKTFQYQGKIYTKIVPAKTLFRSNMVHEVTTRGSIFALDLDSGTFTILPSHAERSGHNQREYHLMETQTSHMRRQAAAEAATVAREKLYKLRAQIAGLQQTLEGM